MSIRHYFNRKRKARRLQTVINRHNAEILKARQLWDEWQYVQDMKPWSFTEEV